MNEEGYVIAEEPSIDLEIAEIMVDELEDYIINEDLYRTVIAHTSAGNRNLSMSGGDLLARLGRLQGERDVLSDDELERLDAVQKRADAIIYSLKSRFHERLNREFKSRLDTLRWFLDDCAEDLKKCRSEYPFEMRNRQRIEEIVSQLGDDASPALLTALNQVDQRIRQFTSDSPFIWDSRLERVYPRQPYWYLYRRP